LINFFANGKDVSVTTASGTAFPAGDFVYTAVTKKLEIKGTKLASYRSLALGATVQAKILLAGETDPYTVNIIITN
jgi:hypothetical protein